MVAVYSVSLSDEPQPQDVTTEIQASPILRQPADKTKSLCQLGDRSPIEWQQ